MIYNVSFDICAAIISAFSLYLILSKKDMRSSSNRLLMYIIIAELVSAIFDIWSSVANSYVMDYSYFFRDILNYIFLFTHTSTACLFAWYMIMLLGLRHRIGKALLAIFLLPEILGVVLLLALNPVLNWVFYYDSSHIYSHGIMIYALYGAGYFYILFATGLAVRFRGTLRKAQRHAAICLLVFSIIPIFIQQVFMPHQLLELFFQSIGIFGFLTTVENLNEVYNPITNVYSRVTFLRNISLAIKSGSRFAAVTIKLSRSEYLQAMLMGADYANGLFASIAECLKELSLNDNVYDCERGHFVILTDYNSPKATKMLVQNIAQRFTAGWSYRNHIMQLPAQLCIINIPEDVQTAELLMQLVDLTYTGIDAAPQTVTASLLQKELQQRQTPVSASDPFSKELLEMMDQFVAGTTTLTPAERHIMRFYIDGHEIAEIPALAFISINTVRKHNKNIYRKLGVGTKEELMLYIDLLRRSNRLDELNTVQ